MRVDLCIMFLLFHLLRCVHFCFIYVAEVVVSPPFVFLPLVKSLLRSDFHVAAQNCWVRKGGAFTGEVRYALWTEWAICWLFFGSVKHVSLASLKSTSRENLKLTLSTSNMP